MVPSKRFSAVKKGKAPREGPGSLAPKHDAAIPASTPRPQPQALAAATVPLRVVGVAPVAAALSMKGNVPWSRGLPGCASIRRRC